MQTITRLKLTEEATMHLYRTTQIIIPCTTTNSSRSDYTYRLLPVSLETTHQMKKTYSRCLTNRVWGCQTTHKNILHYRTQRKNFTSLQEKLVIISDPERRRALYIKHNNVKQTNKTTNYAAATATATLYYTELCRGY